MRRFNERVAARITDLIGTMWTAYLFAALALVSLPAALLSGDAIVIVGWVAQTFLQLVLLPIIMVGQALQQQRHDALTEQHAQALGKLDAIHAAVTTQQ
ncbi:hypothetical protein LQK89_02810 [Curtobacterium sp. C1]|uniref:hypothetical protein n=1 Tax=Curtobacterium sp. C1 TaxID=2898151 RepID=UPI001E528317|nr:hypothetical protein [Curtobacterium sp. C1]UFU14649.1 hypothetical protein LQK89_02810 [Curtobacterium sp. C1]